MNRAPGYRWALKWLVDNDDCYYLDEPDTGLSVTASLVADLYSVDDARVRADLIKLRNKEQRV
jgi:hypothetical protein